MASSGSGDGRFDMPYRFGNNKDNGDIYVVDSDNNRVQRFQSDGDFDNLEFGSSDSGDDEYLGSPSAIAVHKSSLTISMWQILQLTLSLFLMMMVDFLFKFW